MCPCCMKAIPWLAAISVCDETHRNDNIILEEELKKKDAEVPKQTRWGRLKQWFNDENKEQWCTLLNHFHEEFFMRACETINSDCPVLPFRFRGVLLSWHGFLDAVISGEWKHHHPNPRSENAFVQGAKAFRDGLHRLQCWFEDPAFLAPALLDGNDEDSREVAREMLKNRGKLHPRAAQVDEVLGDDGFWDTLSDFADGGECTKGLKRAKQVVFRQWYGLPLHSMLVEQCMSVMRRHTHRCLHAHLPHQRRHLRRVKNKTRLDPSMVEVGGVAHQLWEDAKKNFAGLGRQRKRRRLEKKAMRRKMGKCIVAAQL